MWQENGETFLSCCEASAVEIGTLTNQSCQIGDKYAIYLGVGEPSKSVKLL